MSKRRITKFRPGLERLEPKRPLSAGGSAASLANLKSGAGVPVSDPAETTSGSGAASAVTADSAVSPDAVKPLHGYLVFRITQPSIYNNKITPPFAQVLVQSTPPVPGQVYNVLSIIVRNGTLKTFNASDGFTVHLSGQQTTTPILTGNEQWGPGQNIVFYVLTKKYYPIHNQLSGGFVFNLDNAKSVAVPGPSAIFLRLKYNPTTFPRQLDEIVAFGQGAQGGAGVKFGMPDTALYEFLPSITQRGDFGGYF